MTGCQLYLISPNDVGGDFPQRLEAALSAGPVAAFQLRVKDKQSHELAALAQPLLDICRAHEVAFILGRMMAIRARPGKSSAPMRRSV